MFVVYVGNLCPRIYIRTNEYTSICFIFFKIVPITLSTKLRPPEKRKFWLPTNIDPYELNDFKVTCIYIKNRYRHLYASISWTLKVPDLVLIEN